LSEKADRFEARKAGENMRFHFTESTRSGLPESVNASCSCSVILVAWAGGAAGGFLAGGDSDPQATAMFQAAERGNVAAIEKILRAVWT
jgi:hypothetical protein